jgi:hypothetical protein
MGTGVVVAASHSQDQGGHPGHGGHPQWAGGQKGEGDQGSKHQISSSVTRLRLPPTLHEITDLVKSNDL